MPVSSNVRRHKEHMPQYDIAFARKLAEVALSIAPDIGEPTEESERTAAYLSLLSIELGLKAMLEKSGLSVDRIRARSHRLRELLADVDKIKMDIIVGPGTVVEARGSKLRAKEVAFANAMTTLGNIIDAQGMLTSVYPNEIRYGDTLINFPSRSLAIAANAVVLFAESNWDTLRQ